MKRILLGVFLCVVLMAAGLMAWLYWGKVPVAVADPPFPEERLLTSVPLNARIHRELIKTPPIQIDENNLVSGARVYSEKCAVCHGFHGKPAVVGAHLYPSAPSLWEKHQHGAESHLGVSDDPPGETYWKVANGIRLTGMPAYKDQLTDTEIWQVSLLLANADKPLPPAAVLILRSDLPQTAAPELPVPPVPEPNK